MKLFFASVMLLLGLAFQVHSQDPNEADALWYQNLFHPKKNNFENGIRVANEKLSEAQKGNDKSAEAKALIELGALHLTNIVDYEQAMGWLIRSLTLEDSLSLRKEKIFTCLTMARVFENVGDNFKSLELLHQAQQLSDYEKNRYIQTLILNESGRVKAAQGKDEAAFEDYDLALEYARDLNQQSMEAETLIHIGQLLTHKKKNTQALENFKGALSIYRALNDKMNEAFALNEVGEMYRVMKNHDRALANHKAALDIHEKLKDDKGLAQSYNNISILYFDEKNYKRAISNLQLALQAAQRAQSQDELLKSYDYLSKCYQAEKDFKKAFDYREEFLNIQNLVNEEKNERQLLEAQNRYVMRNQEQQINKLEEYNEQREKVIEAQNNVRNILILVMVLMAIIVALAFYLYSSQKKSARKLEEINATKDKLFSIIGHDLKGPLNSLTSFSHLLLNHIDMISKDEIKMLSLDIDKSLKNLFTLLENLLEWSRSQTGGIDFKPEDFDLADVLKENEALLKMQAQNKKITIVNENKNQLPVSLHKNSINTVVRNLLSNAIKFTPENGTITLRAEEHGKDYLISVTDTGVGMSPTAIEKLFKLGTKHSTLGTAKEKGTGLGLILCKEFVEKNGGAIGVESKEGVGSKFFIFVPKRK